MNYNFDILRKIAKNNVPDNPDIPNASLTIGENEVLSFIPVTLLKAAVVEKNLKKRLAMSTPLDSDNWQYEEKGKEAVNPASIEKTYWIGEGLVIV